MGGLLKIPFGLQCGASSGWKVKMAIWTVRATLEIRAPDG